MVLPRMRSPRGSTRRRMALWSALAIGSILPSVGCQVEYAGMTLPSGRYMHDDVQYFPSGPDFPWANTQAATQRARMRAMGIEPPAERVGGGAIDPTQGTVQRGGRIQNINTQPETVPPGDSGCIAGRRNTWRGCSAAGNAPSAPRPGAWRSATTQQTRVIRAAWSLESVARTTTITARGVAQAGAALLAAAAFERPR